MVATSAGPRNEGLQVEFIITTHPRQAVTAQLDGRSARLTSTSVTRRCPAFCICETQFVQPVVGGGPRGVVLVCHTEAVVPKTRSLIPCAEMPDWTVHNAGAVIHHARGQIIDRRTTIGVADAVGDAIENVDAEELVVARVVAHT